MLTLPHRNVTETGEIRKRKPRWASTASTAADSLPTMKEDQSFLIWGKTDLTTVLSGNQTTSETQQEDISKITVEKAHMRKQSIGSTMC